MSLQTPTHHTEDWSRSSFFDINSEMVKDLNLESDQESDNEDICNDDKLALDSTFYSIDNDIDVNSYTENPFMNEIMQYMIDKFAKLIRSGELPPTFMDKMAKNPEEIVAFIQENHVTIGNELSDKLDPETRPTLYDIINNKIIPNKYYPHIKIIKKQPTKNYTNTETETERNDKHNKKYIDTKTKNKKIIQINTEKDEKIEELQAIINNMKQKELQQEQKQQKQLEINNEKDNKINELLVIINGMKKENEDKKREEKEKEELLLFSKSNNSYSVENDLYYKHKNEIDIIKTEYNKVLNNNSEMEVKYKELEDKHNNTLAQLRTMERSKIALLSAFNGEMDRMRANIKKYNCLSFSKSLKTPALSV